MRESSFEILLHEVEFRNKMMCGLRRVLLGKGVYVRDESGEDGEFWCRWRSEIQNVVDENTS